MDMVTITAAARVTGAEDMVAETEVRTEGTSGTWVRTGVKGTHPILAIPNTDNNSSAETRTTATEVCWDDYQVRGGVYLGKMGKSGVKK